jgi:hypothetical protein
MNPEMSKKTRDELMEKWRGRYARAGKEHKQRILDQAVELLGYHRKAAIRALRAKGPAPPRALALIGRPREYAPQKLLPVLKPVWFAPMQPCGRRLAVMLPEWVPAYEADHRQLCADVRQALVGASARTLERLLKPLRVEMRRRGGTRPGSLLRQSIPIRGEWSEKGPGWLEVDTVALCGGCLDDRHLWMLDDIVTGWTELRALQSRGQHHTLKQIRDVEENLPFALCGIDSDNGGEFLNHHLLRYLQERPKPVRFTRARPYHKNDNAHVEQRNWTHVRQHFGYERYDHPELVAPINALCKGAMGLLHNHFLATQKLKQKRREGSRIVREYGPVQTPYARVLAAAETSAEAKARLRALHAQLNPFELAHKIEQAKRRIEHQRLQTSA